MTRQTSLSAIPAGILAALLGLGAVPAGAQSTDQSSGAPAITAEALSEEKLAAFVTAAERVREIFAEFRPEFDAASTDEERARVSKAVNDGVVAALDATPGITAEEYLEIAAAARQDEALMTRIQTMMQGS